MTAQHYQFIPINGWVNSYAHEDALRHELGHELGERVEQAIENEAIGFGALFDLSYANWCKENA